MQQLEHEIINTSKIFYAQNNLKGADAMFDELKD